MCLGVWKGVVWVCLGVKKGMSGLREGMVWVCLGVKLVSLYLDFSWMAKLPFSCQLELQEGETLVGWLSGSGLEGSFGSSIL